MQANHSQSLEPCTDLRYGTTVVSLPVQVVTGDLAGRDWLHGATECRNGTETGRDCQFMIHEIYLVAVDAKGKILK